MESTEDVFIDNLTRIDEVESKYEEDKVALRQSNIFVS